MRRRRLIPWAFGALIALGISIAPTASAGQLLWSQSGGIWRGDSDGTHSERWAAAFDSRGVAVSGTMVAWSDVEPRVPITPTGVVRAATLEGGNQHNVAVNLPLPSGLDIDPASNSVYWSDLEQNAILRVPLDGSGEPQNVLADVPSIATIHDLAIDRQSGKVYFGYVNPLIDGLVEPHGIAIDIIANQLFWVDIGSRKIQRSDMNGGNKVDVFSDLDSPRALAYSQVPESSSAVLLASVAVCLAFWSIATKHPCLIPRRSFIS